MMGCVRICKAASVVCLTAILLLLGTNTAPGPIIAVSSAAAVLILVTGAFYFRRMEKTFADVV